MVDDLIQSVSVNGQVSVNDGDAYIDLALQGFGLIQGPRYMLTNHFEAGTLKEVLPKWTPAPMPISAVYLQSRHLSQKVRVFVDWVAELFASCPLLGGSALPLDEKCAFACDQKSNHEYTLRTLVEQHNIAEARTLKT